MLGSLIKFEFKATYKIFFILYAVITAFSIVYRFYINLYNGVGYISKYITLAANDIYFIIFLLIYLFLMATVGILTIFIIIRRFNNNLFGDVGYLMNTIPVEPWKNIASKVIVSLVWMVCGIFVCFVSVILLLTYNATFTELFKGFGEFVLDIIKGDNLFITICNFFLCFIIQQAANIMIIFCSISIGRLFNRHRKIIAFVAFLIINTITSTITLNIVFGDAGSFIYSNVDSKIEVFNNIFSFGILYNIVIFVIMFVVTNYILKNRLNLD